MGTSKVSGRGTKTTTKGEIEREARRQDRETDQRVRRIVTERRSGGSQTDQQEQRRHERVAGAAEHGLACAAARPPDVVLVCGKGHEQSMCFGEIEYEWDDRDALRAALRGERYGSLPTALGEV